MKVRELYHLENIYIGVKGGQNSSVQFEFR